jgi:hypothetical protein
VTFGLVDHPDVRVRDLLAMGPDADRRTAFGLPPRADRLQRVDRVAVHAQGADRQRRVLALCLQRVDRVAQGRPRRRTGSVWGCMAPMIPPRPARHAERNWRRRASKTRGLLTVSAGWHRRENRAVGRHETNAQRADERARSADEHAALARERAADARQRAADDAARGNADGANLNERMAQLHEGWAVLQEDAAADQWEHAAHEREAARRLGR